MPHLMKASVWLAVIFLQARDRKKFFALADSRLCDDG